jgi:hypothetical protein
MPIRHGGMLTSRASTWPRDLLTQHNGAAIIQANDVERVLTDIKLRQPQSACSLSQAPLASLSLAGQEHGRTIPLPELPC